MKNPASIIIYASFQRLSKEQDCVAIRHPKGKRMKPLFVRAVCSKHSELEALDRAKPLDGEFILNSLSLPHEDTHSPTTRKSRPSSPTATSFPFVMVALCARRASTADQRSQRSKRR